MKQSNFDQMEKFSIEDFQKNFDEIMERVEDGESFLIESEYGNAIMAPYQEVREVFKETGLDEDIIQIHTDHEEGS